MSLLDEAKELGLTDDQLLSYADSIEATAKKKEDAEDIVEWAEREFYIEETEAPIKLMPHQKAILRYFFKRNGDGHFPFQTLIYSSRKKSGKTTIAGIIGRWAAETWGKYGEVLCVGNDSKQAMERAFAKCKISLELTPGYRRSRQELPGKWTVRSKEMECITTGTKVRAVATDYQGEAGANPILVVWTELWGFIHKDALRFWAEMSPSPTRDDSLSLIETYAGYEGESELLYDLYEATVLNGRQLTAGELGDVGAFEEAPNPDSLIPVYVNEVGGTVAYWDDGPASQRMPWQRGERGERYYASETIRQTPSQMLRLHENQWVSAESEFVEMVLWDLCNNPLPLVPGEKTPLVVALDAAVTGDSFALVVVSRDPDRPDDGVAMRHCFAWEPQTGQPIDFAAPERACRELAANFNVTQFAYDDFQLHDFAMRLTKEGVGWFFKFGQGAPRLVSDKLFYDLIVQRRWRHDGDIKFRRHIGNANKKQSADEDTKLRIIKKSAKRRIDLAVAGSMAASECLRLNL